MHHAAPGGRTPGRGSAAQLFLATGAGPVDLVPAGLPVSLRSRTELEVALPCTWSGGRDQGLGYVALQLVQPGLAGTPIGLPLIASGSGAPSILGVDGTFLHDTSWDPSTAVANIDQVLVPGERVRVDGEAFAEPVVNLFTWAGNCGPVVPSFHTATELSFTVPAGCAEGPGALQVVNTTDFGASAAVTAAIGARIAVDDARLGGARVVVTGAGFSPRTVVNLFARGDGADIRNFGGIGTDGPRLPLTLESSGRMSFELPVGLRPGRAYVQAINPPFIQTTSSGAGPVARWISSRPSSISPTLSSGVEPGLRGALRYAWFESTGHEHGSRVARALRCHGPGPASDRGRAIGTTRPPQAASTGIGAAARSSRWSCRAVRVEPSRLQPGAPSTRPSASRKLRAEATSRAMSRYS